MKVRKWGLRLVGLVMLGLIASCLPAPERVPGPLEEPSDDTQADILAFLERYYDDLSARDWDAFADYFWPGATLTTVWQPAGDAAPRVVVVSVPDFVAQAPLGPDSQPIFEERMTASRVWREGSLAQAWTRYEARFGSSDSLFEWEGTDAFTLMKHEGRWRIVSLAYAADE